MESLQVWMLNVLNLNKIVFLELFITLNRFFSAYVLKNKKARSMIHFQKKYDEEFKWNLKHLFLLD